MNRIKTAYNELFSLSKEIKLLESITFLLEWDQETQMPKGGQVVRPDQIALMASEIHKRRTGEKMQRLLETLLPKSNQLNGIEQANMREWERDFKTATALPAEFVKTFAKLTAEAMPLWIEARKNNSFDTFAPTLKNIVTLSQEKGAYLAKNLSIYNTLLDTYEPGMTSETLDALFFELEPALQELLQKIQGGTAVDNRCILGNFSEKKQLEFGRVLLKSMGYDLEKGRLDLSTHPFSISLHPSDSRVTTRVHTDSLFDSIAAVMHEGGHSLYEMGLAPEYYGSPLCEATSFAIHESQSRLWETRIGQSLPFWTHFYPLLQKTFDNELQGVSLDAYYKAINKVTPSLIRVESDEVTYNLHIIIRYRLEKKLIDGSLKVKDLPEAWNRAYQNLLGVSPTNDQTGCLQDIHWSMGAFGYFPTYSLGNLYAAHFFSAFEIDFPFWEERVSKGELLFIKAWLNEKIHKHGRFFSAAELAKEVVGKPLLVAPYIGYLTNKYREINRF